VVVVVLVVVLVVVVLVVVLVDSVVESRSVVAVTVVVLVVVVVLVLVVLVVVVVVAQKPASQISMLAISVVDTTAGGNAGMSPAPCRTTFVMLVRHWMFGEPSGPPVAVGPWHNSHCAV
jgi:hypothetical protein